MDKLEVYVNISQEEFSFVCRICLNKGELKPFDYELSTLFFALTDIQVKPDDNLPKNICLNCIFKLQDISQFIDSSKLNDAGLRRIIKVEQQSLPDQCEESMDNDVFNESADFSVDVKVEDQSADFKENEENESFDNCETEAIVGKKVTDNKEKSTPSDSKKFDCFHCDKTFPSKNKLKVHLVSHSDEQLYECKLCGKKFKFSHNLVRHTNSEHKNLKPFKCEICHKDIQDANIMDHMKCHLVVESGNTLEIFYYSNPQQIDETPLTQITSPTTKSEIHVEEDSTLCSFCGKIFHDETSLKIHQVVHRKTARNRIFCSVCDRDFRGKYHYKRHLRSHIHYGKKCKVKFSSEDVINEHIHDVDEKSHSCPICRKQFCNETTLRRHLSLHSDDTLYKCDLCDKTFKVKRYYKNHLATHNPTSAYLCSVCGKHFSRKALMDIHSRVHTGEKPYGCETCGKRFSQHSSLVKHTKFHTGDRTFQCSSCEKAFKQSQHLKSHIMLKHTKEKPHACSFCGKRFTLASTMRIHTRIHTGDKPFPCPDCGNRFSDSSAMRKHQRIHHPRDKC